MWLKIGNSEFRVFKQLTSNKLVIPEPTLLQQVDGEPVVSSRVISASHWIRKGTGEPLGAETVLKNAKGEVVPLAEARHVIDHYNNIAINSQGNQVDKKKIQYFIVNPDGSISDQVMPYTPTERIEVKETPEEANELADPGISYAYWAPASVLENFLIHEEYELVAADPRNDAKAFRELEATLKRDEIAICTYSNGGFKMYYAFLTGLVKDGKFVWLLKVSDKQVEYNFLHDIPAPTTALKQVQTLKTMPPIAQLLTVPPSKKK